MLTFTPVISCLTTSNLPWFMDLTFQVPMPYCFLQHQTLLLSPVPSITGYCFWFGSIPSFFLELFLHWSPVAYWTPTDLGSFSFSVLSFCLLILFMGFSRQEYWSGLPFPSPVDHILSDLSTMTRPSWVAHTAWLSFTELDTTVVCVIRLASFLWSWFYCVCPLMPSRNTYCLTSLSLTSDVEYLFKAAPVGGRKESDTTELLYLLTYLITLNISCHALQACRVSAARSIVKHRGFACILLVASVLLL